jgi:nitrate reductase gamma subunit
MRAESNAAMAVRVAVGLALVIGTVILWIRRRDRWGVKIRAFFEAGRQQKAAT